MNFIERVHELFSLVVPDDDQETAVETRPSLPQEWRPAGEDLIPLPQQPVKRAIQRVKVSQDMKIYEQEVIYITEPKTAPRQAAVRERCNGGPRFVEADGSPASAERIAQYYAGEFDVVNTAPEIPRQAWE